MCGIVGVCAQRDVSQILLEGLKRLEYRGYDSAGLAILHDHQINRLRTKGKVSQLDTRLKENPLAGTMGIAHTRWATHGIPSESNAHPHMSEDVIAVVHNGIIENHNQLRETLEKGGYQFTSDTDTEIIAHLMNQELKKEDDYVTAIRNTVNQLEGAFALGIIHVKEPERLFAVRCGSPLVIGVGIGENFLASDPLALLPVTQNFIYLEEGDIAELTRKNIIIYDSTGKEVKRSVKTTDISYGVTERGHYRHFMEKEIFEQADAIQETIAGRVSQSRIFDETIGEKAPQILERTKRIQIVACGTSYHAGLVARHWLESIAKIPCQVEVASEYRYRETVIEDDTLFITISQSGETADTLAALRGAKEKNYLASLAICNVPESSLARESELVFMTHAGTEIGVASTKAFTTQLVVLLMLTLAIARYRGLDSKEEARIVEELKQLPEQVKTTLQLDKDIKNLAEAFIDKEHTLFVARGLYYPIVLEGALKLKEISYIHAEAYPAGELKHGPLALVDREMPVVSIAPNEPYAEKLKSNLSEISARGGQLFLFVDKDFYFNTNENICLIKMPKINPLLAPIIYTIPLQLLAYHVAVLKGTDVDQPRNLAKSVTVE